MALDAPGNGRNILNLLVVFERDEDGWEVASCPTLPGCHSQGRTRDEALANIREAIRGYLASLRAHGENLPSSTEFEVLEIPVDKHLAKHRDQDVTSRLNRVYGEQPSGLAPELRQAQGRSLADDGR